MLSLRRRLIGIGWAVFVVGSLVFGAREALASVQLGTCEDCDASTNCVRCCNDWGFPEGLCPLGGGYCLCW